MEHMDRRKFLKSVGATALLPAIPAPAVAMTPVASATVAAPFSAHTYQWAEMIVRAHNKCNLGLLQRSLRIDAGAASALKESLIKNGIISAQANAYGIHTATKPLYEGAFMSVSDTVEKAKNVAEQVSEYLETDDEEIENTQANSDQEKESENRDLENEMESVSDVSQNDADQTGT